MRRIFFMFIVATLFGIGSGYSQEIAAGAGRIEVSAFPGGGIFFTQSADKTEPDFGDYALGASFTFNANKWIGLEGEIGGGIGMRQTLTFNQTIANKQKTPHMLGYTGNVMYYPAGNDRAVVPYATGGAGGLTLLNTTAGEALGILDNETYLTGNVGGGLKWFSRHRVGVRADYRFIGVRSKETAPLFFGEAENRYGHRVYGGIVLTY
jgi:hypothetical protein